jgi:hypothetical protein
VVWILAAAVVGVLAVGIVVDVVVAPRLVRSAMGELDTLYVHGDCGFSPPVLACLASEAEPTHLRVLPVASGGADDFAASVCDQQERILRPRLGVGSWLVQRIRLCFTVAEAWVDSREAQSWPALVDPVSGAKLGLLGRVDRELWERGATCAYAMGGAPVAREVIAPRRRAAEAIWRSAGLLPPE